jgi:hypothetical protein
VHNELLKLRIQQLENMYFEATGQKPAPAPYLTMFDKGALANADPAQLAAYVKQASHAIATGSTSGAGLITRQSSELSFALPSAAAEASSEPTVAVQLRQLQSGLDEVARLTKSLSESQAALEQWKVEVAQRLLALEGASRTAAASMPNDNDGSDPELVIVTTTE